MKTLTFSVRGDYARFRRPYTTTSALTYSVIHPIAIKGMIGAIMGIDYSELYEYSKTMKIGIIVVSEVKKDMQSFNLKPITKNNGAESFQSRIEFLRNVQYKIFIQDEESKLKKVKQKIDDRDFIFTPYLGCSEYVAKMGNAEIIKGDVICAEEILIDSVVRKSLIVDIDDIESVNFDNIPIKNSKIREYTEYMKVAFSNKSVLKVKNDDCVVKVGENYVYLF